MQTVQPIRVLCSDLNLDEVLYMHEAPRKDEFLRFDRPPGWVYLKVESVMHISEGDSQFQIQVNCTSVKAPDLADPQVPLPPEQPVPADRTEPLP